MESPIRIELAPRHRLPTPAIGGRGGGYAAAVAALAVTLLPFDVTPIDDADDTVGGGTSTTLQGEEGEHPATG